MLLETPLSPGPGALLVPGLQEGDPESVHLYSLHLVPMGKTIPPGVGVVSYSILLLASAVNQSGARTADQSGVSIAFT